MSSSVNLDYSQKMQEWSTAWGVVFDENLKPNARCIKSLYTENETAR